MTTSQRNTISNPASGLLIFNLDENCFQYYLGNSTSPQWVSLESDTSQSGSYGLGGSTSKNWNYFNVTFSRPFTTVPSILLTYREGTGTDNTGSKTVTHIKVANASETGFTICIYDTDFTTDVFIDWVASVKTQ
jgi:hypothetical protein